jgi:glycosyltransferase involved in cell wall biosynthesis
MPRAQKNAIQEDIRAMKQDAAKLIFLGNVPSLASALKEIAPDFFLCSYPEGGGKTMVEAISVGLPILAPRAQATPPLICADMSMGAALTITTLEEVPQAVKRLKTEQKELSQHTREIFEQHYAFSIFQKKLLDIVLG